MFGTPDRTSDRINNTEYGVWCPFVLNSHRIKQSGPTYLIRWLPDCLYRSKPSYNLVGANPLAVSFLSRRSVLSRSVVVLSRRFPLALALSAEGQNSAQTNVNQHKSIAFKYRQIQSGQLETLEGIGGQSFGAPKLFDRMPQRNQVCRIGSLEVEGEALCSSQSNKLVNDLQMQDNGIDRTVGLTAPGDVDPPLRAYRQFNSVS
ncbi:hypothetical protein ACFX2J_018901 [Malus domestica]|nr:uncharacterized protein LOC103423090 [Malus domestica]